MWKHRYAHSYLQLDDKAVELPLSARVTSLVIPADGPRYVAPSSVLSLLRTHRRVEIAAIMLNDNERKRPVLRTSLRIGFSRTLQSISCEYLSTLNLEYRCEDPSDQRFANADVST